MIDAPPAGRPYDSKAAANWFLDLGQPLTPMKLQKLVYFAHGWSLALTGVPLIKDAVEAWRYGPVIPALYHEFKHNGARPITDRATCLTRASDGRLRVVTPRLNDTTDTFTPKLL